MTTPGELTPRGFPTISEQFHANQLHQAITDLADAVDYGGPRAKIVAGANQSMPHGVTTLVDFAGGSVTYDSGGMADLANDAIVIPVAGWYRFHARVVFVSNATGYRLALIGRTPFGGGTPDWLGEHYGQAANGTLTIISLGTEPVLCAAGDVIKLHANQGSGAALNLSNANGAGRYSSLAAECTGGLAPVVL